jgi:hypothetical protein
MPSDCTGSAASLIADTPRIEGKALMSNVTMQCRLHPPDLPYPLPSFFSTPSGTRLLPISEADQVCQPLQSCQRNNPIGHLLSRSPNQTGFEISVVFGTEPDPTRPRGTGIRYSVFGPQAPPPSVYNSRYVSFMKITRQSVPISAGGVEAVRGCDIEKSVFAVY